MASECEFIELSCSCCSCVCAVTIVGVLIEEGLRARVSLVQNAVAVDKYVPAWNILLLTSCTYKCGFYKEINLCSISTVICR